jgi:hypothetical protein
MVVSRQAYGEQVKRHYLPGLPPAEKEKSEIVRIPYERGYDNRRSPRAWARGELVLVPPAVWSMQSRDRRRVRNLLSHARDPESVGAVMTLVTAVASAFASPAIDAAKPLLAVDAVQRRYAEDRRRRQVRDDAARAASTDPLAPDLVRGRYASSVHSTFDEGSKLLSDADLTRAPPGDRPLWMDRELKDQPARREHKDELAAKALRETLEIIERMKLRHGRDR